MAEISLLDAFEKTAEMSAQKAVDVIKAENYVKGTLFHGTPIDPEFEDTNGNTVGQDLIMTAQSGQNLWEACLDSFSTKSHTHNNYVTLDSNGKVPASQLPDGLDDVIEIKIKWQSDGSIDDVTDVNGNSIPASSMKKDILYVNVAEDKYVNNIYRWSGSTLVLCPTIPKTENMTVEFEYPNAGHITSEQIESGETLSQLFAKIHALINDNNYSHGQFKTASDDIYTHRNNSTIHVKGIDTTPTADSENVVTSGGVYGTFAGLAGRITALEYYKDNPTELPFIEESTFETAISTALKDIS